MFSILFGRVVRKNDPFTSLDSNINFINLPTALVNVAVLV